MKEKFDWDRFLNPNNGIAVHCSTIDEAVAFCDLMDKHSLTWVDGELYIDKTRWGVYKTETCYSSEGEYANKSWFEELGYKVLKFSDFDFTDGTPDKILNANVYGEKIKKTNEPFKVVKGTHEIKPCEKCENCIFCETNLPCRSLRVNWLVSPYEPPEEKPVITDIVKKFLEICNPKNYIARDKNKEIWLYENKPSKTNSIWWTGTERMRIKKTINKDLYHGFDFVKWEDNEPWKVADLLQIAAEQ